MPSPADVERQLRLQIVEVAQQMYARDFIAGIAGNISARLPDGNLLITPSGGNKAHLTPAEILAIDLDGNCLCHGGICKPTSELPMHLEVYRQRPDVGAVVHAHPITCVALSLVGISMQTPYIPEALVILGPVPTTPYATPSSTENRDAIRSLIGSHDAIVLAHHGSLTVGRDVDEAYMHLEILEHTAKVVAKAHELGTPRVLADDEVDKLLAMRVQLGFSTRRDSPLSLKIADQIERLALDLKKSGW